MQPVCRWRASRRLVVLAYHEIDDVDRFSWQVRYLREVMHPVSIDDVLDALHGGRGLPRSAVLITFDDGDPSVHDAALPVLREEQVPGLAFVVAGLIGTTQSLWWKEVDELVRGGATARVLSSCDPEECIRTLKRLSNRERLECIDELRTSPGIRTSNSRQLTQKEVARLVSAGVAVGNHTLTHPCLDQCSDEVLEAELVGAHERLTEILSEPPTAFAYPNGNSDRRTFSVLERLGYQAAFLFDHRVGRFPPRNPYSISRIRVSSTASRERFRILLSGLHSSLHHLIGRS